MSVSRSKITAKRNKLIEKLKLQEANTSRKDKENDMKSMIKMNYFNNCELQFVCLLGV